MKKAGTGKAAQGLYARGMRSPPNSTISFSGLSCCFVLDD
jgi:hypothetical protein